MAETIIEMYYNFTATPLQPNNGLGLDLHLLLIGLHFLDGRVYSLDELLDVDGAIPVQVHLGHQFVELLALAALLVGQELIYLVFVDLPVIVFVEQPECLLELLPAEFGGDLAGEGNKLAILDSIGPIHVQTREYFLYYFLSL